MSDWELWKDIFAEWGMVLLRVIRWACATFAVLTLLWLELEFWPVSGVLTVGVVVTWFILWSHNRVRNKD